MAATPQVNYKELRRKNSACNASSLAYEAQNSPIGNYNIFIPYNNGKECQYFLRHCFLVQAIKLGEITINDKKLLNLKYLTSRGFGGDGHGGAATYAENIFEHNQYKKQIISCKLVFDKSNLTDEELKIYKSASKAMDHKWADITSAMEDETNSGYDPYKHNCCTVAYKILEGVNKNVKEIVDPTEINYGIGVIFTGIGDAFSGFVSSEAKETIEFSEKLSDKNPKKNGEKTINPKQEPHYDL